MKTIIAAVTIIAFLIGTPAVYASNELPHAKDPVAAKKDGYNHGIADGKDNCGDKDGCHWYILEPGKGFKFHTQEFNEGYIKGFCEVNPTGGSDADEATWSCSHDASHDPEDKNNSN